MIQKIHNEFGREFYESEEALRKNLWVCTPKDAYYFNEMTRFDLIQRWLHEYCPEGRILDVGCGDGYLLCLLSESNTYELFGVDLSMRRLRRVHKIAQQRGILLTQSSIDRLPARNGTFDACILSELMEHLKDLSHLKEVNRLLKPNGYLFVTVPYKEQLSYYSCPHCKKKFNPSGHLRVFDEESLRAIMENYQFQVQEHAVLGSSYLKRLHSIAERYFRIRPTFGSYYVNFDQWFAKRWPNACTYLAMVGQKRGCDSFSKRIDGKSKPNFSFGKGEGMSRPLPSRELR